MVTLLHAVEAGAMENGIEERPQLTYIYWWKGVRHRNRPARHAYRGLQRWGRRGVVAQARHEWDKPNSERKRSSFTKALDNKQLKQIKESLN